MDLYTIEDETGMTVASAATAQELQTKYHAGSMVFKSQVVRDSAGIRISFAEFELLTGLPLLSKKKSARSAHPLLSIKWR